MSEVHEGMFDEGDERNVFSKLFILQKILGKGAFGTVVAATQRSTQKQFAVKIVQKNLMDQLHYDCLLKEADILQQLNHNNIVKFQRILESETRVFLVMELVQGGSLQDLIEQRNKEGNPIKDEEAASIMKSVLSALHYIHSKDIIHRDLKPHNILIANHNDMESIKICDFGLSAQYDSIFESSNFTARVGTKTFMSPELFLKKPYSKPVDIWSCGIILYMLLSGGKHPLYVDSDTETTYLAKLEKPEWKFNSMFNRYSKDLFCKLVSVDPIARYTVEQVQNHPWITRRFHEGIPLTSPEKMRAFSHSQILSRALKSMYVLYKLPGAKTDVDTQHQQKIAEVSRKNEIKPTKKGSPFVESFRIHFETVNTDNDLSVASLNNFNRDSNSPSPVSTYGPSSITYSPKLFSPTFGAQQLGTIPESATREIQRDLEENADNEIIERSRTRNFFNDDSFSLPDAQVQIPESKKLQFTLAVVPIKNETSTEASQTNGQTPLQQGVGIPLLEEDDDDDDNRLLALRKARTMETEDREFRSKYKGTLSIGGGGSNVPSNMPSPTHKTTNSMTKTAKKPFFTNALDLDLSQRKDEKLSDFIKEQRKNLVSPANKINDSPKLHAKSNVVPYTPFKDSPSIEASFRSTIKNRSPLARKTQKVERNINNMKLPSLTNTDSKTKFETSSPKKTIVIETKTLGNRSNRLSLSPLKTSKDWSPSKESGKTKIFINEKSPLKEQLASLLSTQFSQAFIKK